MICEMTEAKDKIEWDVLRSEEKRLKHDVMAHAYGYGMVS